MKKYIIALLISLSILSCSQDYEKSSDRNIIVYVHTTPHCGPCNRLKSDMNEIISDMNQNGINVEFVIIDGGAMSYPTIVINYNGEMEEMVGYSNKEVIEKWIAEIVN